MSRPRAGSVSDRRRLGNSSTPGADAPGSLSKADLRRALNWSYVAAAVWAAGNVLAGGVLVNYLAQELGAQGRELRWITAAPALVGLLRLFTPALIVRLGNAKRLCLSTSIASYAILAGMPVAAWYDAPDGRRSLLWILIAVYCLHQLLEQVATVALWTWLGDLVPRRLLGRYFGRRNVVQLVVVVGTLAASGAASTRLNAAFPERPILSYAVLTAAGTLCYFLAMVPLALMPATAPRQAMRTSSLAEIVAPLRHGPSRRLLAYGCWFSFFNGLTSVPQSIFPKAVLKLSFSDLLGMQTTMRVGQAALSPLIGRTSDRYGNVPVLVVSQIAVGLAPLCFLWADVAHPNRLVGAWLLWSFYAGINICLPNLTMLLAPPGGQSPYLSAYYALTSLLLTVGNLASGELFDRMREAGFGTTFGPWTFDVFTTAFVVAFVTRTAGALLLLRVAEPGHNARA